jgi:hypothetical protein
MRLNDLFEEELPKASSWTADQISKLPKWSWSVADAEYVLTDGHKYVVVDNENGFGNTPNNVEVKHIGFVVIMRCTDFLQLAADDQGSQDATAIKMVNWIKSGFAMANPYLKMDIDKEMKKPFQITDHEGRGRVKAILKYLGDIKIPVQIMLWPIKPRALTDEMVQKIKDGYVLPQQFYGMKLTDPDYFCIGKHVFLDVIKS